MSILQYAVFNAEKCDTYREFVKKEVAHWPPLNISLYIYYSFGASSVFSSGASTTAAS